MLEATIRQQADQDWESRDDPQAETPSGVRWKLLVSGERTPPEALTMSIAEIAPGGKLFSHDTLMRKPTTSPAAPDSSISTTQKATSALVLQSSSLATPATKPSAPAIYRLPSSSPSRATASMR